MSEEILTRARRWLLPVQIDTFIGFFCLLVFTICFVVLGACILHPQQLVPAGQNLLGQQASFLTNMHPSLLYVYQVGIFMAFYVALATRLSTQTPTPPLPAPRQTSTVRDARPFGSRRSGRSCRLR